MTRLVALIVLAASLAHAVPMGARVTAWSGKPLPYLRRVAYLESNANPSTWNQQAGPWIATGIWPYSGTKWFLDFEWPNYQKSLVSCINGTYGGGRRFDIGIDRIDAETKGRPELNIVNTFNAGAFVGSNRMQAYLDVPNAKVGLKVLTESYEYQALGSYDRKSGYYDQIFIFGRGNNNLVGYQGGRIYRSTISDYGVVIQDLIPVLDLSGRPCMYDQAPSEVPADDPSRFFYNQGTGEFTWGELDEG